jgi:hypothetical protein
MANITGALHAASQAIDAFVSTLHGPFPVAQYTLEDCKDFGDWGSTHASQQAEMLTLNVAAAWGEYQNLVTRKDAYQTQDDESQCCQ